MPPVEVWEKVLLGEESFFDSVHGRENCIICHGGTGEVDDKEAAHEGMVRDPDATQACASCHGDTVEAQAGSLHQNLQGFLTVLADRSDDEHMPQVLEAYETHCASCHATCGQCHVSRPTNVGGGLLAGHEFKGTPPMSLTCTGCHGSRINDEYKGQNEGVPADVHWNPGGMPCFACHTAEEMHGELGDAEHRYDGPPTPSCTADGCHAEVLTGDGVEHHTGVHLERLSCQVCHSTDYKNCYNCHVQRTEDGTPFFRTDESQMMVRIGLNPIQSPDRPWEYVVVRHVPISRDSFEYYGEDLLPNFDNRPTWTYATPHSIQRNTPQNAACDSCHGNETLFLTEDDVDPDELEANRDVIVRQVP